MQVITEWQKLNSEELYGLGGCGCRVGGLSLSGSIVSAACKKKNFTQKATLC